MSVTDSIRNAVKTSGANKGKFLYFKEGSKIRVRFLSDMEEGLEIPFHNNFAKKVNVPCQTLFDKECKYCDDDELTEKKKYAFSVYVIDDDEVKILMEAVNNCSPIPQLLAMYDNYGTLLDRDFVIQQVGSGTKKSFTIIPQDKSKFRNTKAKKYSEQKILQLLEKGFPDEDEEDEKPKKKGSKAVNKASNAKGKKKPVDDDEDEDDEDDDAQDYDDMSAKELYALCREREIEAKPKKEKQYYITLLEEDDEANEDWGNDDEDDEWEDEE